MNKVTIKAVVMKMAHALTRKCLEETFEFIGEYKDIFKVMLKRAWAETVVENTTCDYVVVQDNLSEETIFEEIKASPLIIDTTENIFTLLREKHGVSFKFVMEYMITALLSGELDPDYTDYWSKVWEKVKHAEHVYKSIDNDVVVYYYSSK